MLTSEDPRLLTPEFLKADWSNDQDDSGYGSGVVTPKASPSTTIAPDLSTIGSILNREGNENEASSHVGESNALQRMTSRDGQTDDGSSYDSILKWFRDVTAVSSIHDSKDDSEKRTRGTSVELPPLKWHVKQGSLLGNVEINKALTLALREVDQWGIPE
ncbi:hypothetical protein M231_00960 [Tremella mesenterica]|uniref:Uncharacterized protein n=1 Tax=Tremella mesenterica TaxID=5217 RepID=A0A4Q1BUI0_TREME|nr:hypothetical protein M231_00960 [Tremella mesenterica]